MAAADQQGGVYHADILSRGARVVRQLPLRAEQSVDVEHKPYDPDEPLRISVHGCTPDELDVYTSTFLMAAAHRDVDHLVRWVVAHLDGVPVTFFRR